MPSQGAKDKPVTTSSKLYLVKQVVTEFKDCWIKDTVRYQYDSQDRLTGYGFIIKGNYQRLYTFTYDSNSRIAQADDYNTTVDTVLYSVIYNYTANGFTETVSYPNGQTAAASFTLNSNHQVARMDETTYYTLFDYDANGNLIHEKSYANPGQPAINQEADMTYDAYKNPFLAQKGNYAFMFLVIPHINTCVNNLKGNMQYQYNSDGYNDYINARRHLRQDLYLLRLHGKVETYNYISITISLPHPARSSAPLQQYPIDRPS